MCPHAVRKFLLDVDLDGFVSTMMPVAKNAPSSNTPVHMPAPAGSRSGTSSKATVSRVVIEAANFLNYLLEQGKLFKEEETVRVACAFSLLFRIRLIINLQRV